jgi:1-acyl-sn-glycerol-3-phosphate acyltransferase
MHAIERWWARRMVSHLRIQLDLAGLEQIDRRERYVVAPLHEGFVDALALFHLPLDLRFVARDELFRWRLLGRYLRTTGQIEITPEQGARAYRQLLRGARDAFAVGESVVVFPQGTILGIESEFMAGAFALARALERPILPVALTGSHRVWEHPYTPRLRYGQRISLRVLPPVVAGRGPALSLDDLRITIRRRLKAAALDGTMARPRHFVPARDGYWDGYAYQIDPDFPQLAEDIKRHRDGIRDTCCMLRIQ